MKHFNYALSCLAFLPRVYFSVEKAKRFDKDQLIASYKGYVKASVISLIYLLSEQPVCMCEHNITFHHLEEFKTTVRTARKSSTLLQQESTEKKKNNPKLCENCVLFFFSLSQKKLIVIFPTDESEGHST